MKSRKKKQIDYSGIAPFSHTFADDAEADWELNVEIEDAVIAALPPEHRPEAARFA